MGIPDSASVHDNLSYTYQLVYRGWGRVTFESTMATLESSKITQIMLERFQEMLMDRPQGPNDIVWAEEVNQSDMNMSRHVRVTLADFLSVNRVADPWRLQDA